MNQLTDASNEAVNLSLPRGATLASHDRGSFR